MAVFITNLGLLLSGYEFLSDCLKLWINLQAIKALTLFDCKELTSPDMSKYMALGWFLDIFYILQMQKGRQKSLGKVHSQ